MFKRQLSLIFVFFALVLLISTCSALNIGPSVADVQRVVTSDGFIRQVQLTVQGSNVLGKEQCSLVSGDQIGGVTERWIFRLHYQAINNFGEDYYAPPDEHYWVIQKQDGNWVGERGWRSCPTVTLRLRT